MSRDHPFSPLRLPGLSALCLMLAGCSAGAGSWPSLAVPPAAPAPPPAPAIGAPPSVTPAGRAAPALSPADAAALVAALPQTLADYSRRIDGQKRLYEQARDHAIASGQELDRRGAEFELSRLSRIESDLAAHLRRLERLPGGRETPEPLRRLTAMHDALVAYLAAERRRLAALAAP